MNKCRHGRHTPAFLLLLLAQGPSYGLALLTKLEEELPYNKLDSAAIYRSLQELEKTGAVATYWDTSEPGPARKWYRITKVGHEKLREFKRDIEERKKNLEFFLNTYSKLMNE